jgi:lipopolysaccharide/colanic/teichoic acid biosynthesis glycosyltransferase
MGVIKDMTALERATYLHQATGRSFLSRLTMALWQANFFLYSIIKRIISFVFALIGIILLSPLFLFVAILIKKEDGGPVLFKQERTGFHGKPFYVLKFRSMKVGNNVRDNSKADEHTKIGNFIRKTSLDELPQLINILRGDMRFIGPRPWIIEYYKYMNNHEQMRTMVHPGITGLAQANGRNVISIYKKIDLDLEYVKKYSIFMDIRVIFDSIRAVLTKEGADAGKMVIHNELDELKSKNKKFVDRAGEYTDER